MREMGGLQDHWNLVSVNNLAELDPPAILTLPHGEPPELVEGRTTQACYAEFAHVLTPPSALSGISPARGEITSPSTISRNFQLLKIG
ncbi:hypothetical protein FHW16_004909 [Phyllobacterium myrsinacearum]|uniref:Uncharacterized protein n=1 Tax=Phyllobacterium myrsinacearum TaxID=28101 RepID=A0A839EUJ0_9HYPH|nr:hypothetical protein [Phyllobacterium myrsinacearum]